MKIKFTIIAILCPTMVLFGISSQAQQKKTAKKDIAALFGINAGAIKKDTKGTVISNKQFSDSLYTGKYVFAPIMVGKKMIEVQLSIASKEESAGLKDVIDALDFKPRPSPDFDLVDMQGKHYKLADLKNKTVVLNFWFKNCMPCVGEMPGLNEIVKTHKNVVFIAITPDKKADVETFLLKHRFNYHIIPGASKVINQFKVAAFPTHYVIKKGMLTHKFIDDESKDALIAAIK